MPKEGIEEMRLRYSAVPCSTFDIPSVGLVKTKQQSTQRLPCVKREGAEGDPVAIQEGAPLYGEQSF